MRRISLKIAALVTIATLATAAPVLASSSSTMPPATCPTLCVSTAGDDARSGASIPTAGRERGRSTAPGLTGQGRSTL